MSASTADLVALEALGLVYEEYELTYHHYFEDGTQGGKVVHTVRGERELDRTLHTIRVQNDGYGTVDVRRRWIVVTDWEQFEVTPPSPGTT